MAPATAHSPTLRLSDSAAASAGVSMATTRGRCPRFDGHILS
jgi:hypothetical protein